MPITPLPARPSREDPRTFSPLADALVAALAQFVTEANALQADVNSNQVAATSASGTATAKAAEAAAARDIALAACNYKGIWEWFSGAMAQPASVYYNNAIWMLIYPVTHVEAETPGVSSAWINVTPATGLGTAAYHSVSDFQSPLGFTPVQQGGGTNQNNSKVRIGWGDTGLRVHVDATDFGSQWPINISGNSSHSDTATQAITVADGAISSAAKIADRVITWAKHAAMTTGKLIGRSSAGGGDPEEIAIGTGLSLSSGVLSCTVSQTPPNNVSYVTIATPPNPSTSVCVRTAAHGFGVVPSEATLEIVCIVAELGYGVGTVIESPFLTNGAGGYLPTPISKDISNAYLVVPSGFALGVLNIGTGAGSLITTANWSTRIKLRVS